LNKIVKQFGTGDSFKTTVDAGSNGIGRFYLKFQPFLTQNRLNRIFDKIRIKTTPDHIGITGLDESVDYAMMYDITGKLLYMTKTGHQESGTISTSGLQPGIYLLRLTGKNGTRGFKVMVHK
jgi:hypothetical protein